MTAETTVDSALLDFTEEEVQLMLDQIADLRTYKIDEDAIEPERVKFGWEAALNAMEYCQP